MLSLNNSKRIVSLMIILGLLQIPLVGHAGQKAYANERADQLYAQIYASTSEPSVPQTKDTEVTKEEAIKHLQSLFPKVSHLQPETAELWQVDYTAPSSNHNAIWHLQGSFHYGNRSFLYVTTIDAISGDIIEHHLLGLGQTPYYSYPLTSYFPAKFTQAEAERIANQFIRKAAVSMLPSDKVRLKLTTDPVPKTLFGDITYHFSFQYLIDGIPSAADDNYIEISGNGAVTGFRGFHSELAYPSMTDKSISSSQALEKYKKELKMELVYFPDNSLDNKGNYRLAYVPVQGIGYMDAKSGQYLRDEKGQYINKDGYPLPAAAEHYAVFKAANKTFKPLTGKELTSKEAQGVVTEQYPLNSDFREPSVGQYTDIYFNKIWTFVWNKRPETGSEDFVTAAVNAKTGQLTTLEVNGDIVKQTPSITKEQAKTKALQLVSLLYPNAASSLRLLDNPLPDIDYPVPFRFDFVQYYHGAQIQNGVVRIGLDGAGKLVLYTGYAIPVSKLALQPKISKEKALEQYRATLKTELQYLPMIDYSSGRPVIQSMKLYYMPISNGISDNGNVINAVSGQLEKRDMYMSYLVKKATELPADAKKHTAVKTLSTLLTFGVLRPEEDHLLHPDKAITIGSWMNMILAGYYLKPELYTALPTAVRFSDVGSSGPYSAAADLFYQRGWLPVPNTQKQLHPERVMTRDELALWLTAFLKRNWPEELQQDQGLYSLKDAGQISHKAEAAIAMKLGLLTPEKGYFRPNAPVTKVQAGSIMIRLLQFWNSTDVSFMQITN